MFKIDEAERKALVSRACEVLTAVTTTSAGVGRREVVASLVQELYRSLTRGDATLPLRWVLVERERERACDISNMVYAAAHVLTVHVGRSAPERLAATARHFRQVQAHVDAALVQSYLAERQDQQSAGGIAQAQG
jgi:hypothetical protein